MLCSNEYAIMGPQTYSDDDNAHKCCGARQCEQGGAQRHLSPLASLCYYAWPAHDESSQSKSNQMG